MGEFALAIGGLLNDARQPSANGLQEATVPAAAPAAEVDDEHLTDAERYELTRPDDLDDDEYDDEYLTDDDRYELGRPDDLDDEYDDD